MFVFHRLHALLACLAIVSSQAANPWNTTRYTFSGLTADVTANWIGTNCPSSSILTVTATEGAKKVMSDGQPSNTVTELVTFTFNANKDCSVTSSETSTTSSYTKLTLQDVPETSAVVSIDIDTSLSQGNISWTGVKQVFTEFCQNIVDETGGNGSCAAGPPEVKPVTLTAILTGQGDTVSSRTRSASNDAESRLVTSYVGSVRDATITLLTLSIDGVSFAIPVSLAGTDSYATLGNAKSGTISQVALSGGAR